MTNVRRFLGVMVFLALAASISTSLQGQSGKKAAVPGTTPQLTPAKQVSDLAEASDSRFTAAGLITYQPVNGDLYFALQLQPKLEATPRRPRDILVMMSTAATQGGKGWIAGHQIAEGIIDAAREPDRISLWTANAPEKTRCLTKDFLLTKDYGEGKLLTEALKKYRKGEYPSGDTDLKNALTKAVESFDSSNKDRQRILLFLGDGLSTHEAMKEKDVLAVAKLMRDRQIAFFPVPLGIQLNPNTLHGLANSTGGIVLRTSVDDEKITDALKRYEEAFACSILYGAKVELPAGVSDVCPSVLPPLRSDSPTLVVGRMKNKAKSIDVTLTGTIAGRKGAASISETQVVQAPSIDNYFLLTMADQWRKASEYPAVLRADRALAYTYEQTRLQFTEYNESAQLALEDHKLEEARGLFDQMRRLAPHDPQAEAGIKIVDRLKDGSLSIDAIKKARDVREKRGDKADQFRIVDGKKRWEQADLFALAKQDAQDEKNPGAQKKPDPKQPGIAPEDLLKEALARQAIEEQKVASAVDDAIRQAKRNLTNDPDGTLDLLRNLKNRVQDHPDLGAQIRDALVTRLQASLRESATQVQQLKLQQRDRQQAVAVTEKILNREQQMKAFEDRVDAQFRIYKNLMTTARFEERTKNEIVEAMKAMHDEARMKGFRVPMAAKAMYDIALAANPLQSHNSLIRKREEKWLSVLMSIEKAHIPYPDEPPIHFPPIATWKALLKARKDKYEVFSLPDDEKGRVEASKIYQLLEQVIETKGLQEPVKLKTALEYFGERFGGKLPIVVDKEAFIEKLGADAPSPYDEDVVLPPVPAKMVMNTALRLVLSQVGKGNATYVIRRSFIEITTVERYLQDKVIRIYPVGDLVMPINGGVQGGGLMMGMGGGMGGMGAMMGMGGGAMGGMMGMAGMGGMGMPGMGGGMMGGMGMPGMGGMGMPGMGGGMMGGMGMPGMGGMGMPGMMGGMGMPGMGGMGMPGMMGGMGMPGMGGMMMGGMGMGGMNMGGMAMAGSFQGAFNGGLGAVGATQASGLINIITRIVDPGNWNQPPTAPVGFMMGMGGMMGFPGMGGFPGMMGGAFPGGMGMMGMGAGPPPDPNINVDPQTSNSIDFFPPAMAIIVRAPSRVHTSITGGIVGGKGKRLEAAAFFMEQERRAGDLLAKGDNKDPKVKVAPGAGGVDEIKDAIAKREKRKTLDPFTIWQEAFEKGGIDAAHVIATADFLFEAGQPTHAAEFLKANLRHGVVVRPWVFEALAVALEASGGDKEEIRRARLSGIALDPTDAQGFVSAARAMADRGQYDRALAFCRQAALLEPTDYHSYEFALACAESAKDAKAMEWAVTNLVSQDWPVDSQVLQSSAQKRLSSLAATLKKENRGTEADSLEATLARLNQRDLVIELVWDNAGGICELEMKVKEPAGSVCNLDQKQSPGGGIMLGYNMLAKTPSSQYVAAQAFAGSYEVNISRVYGQPLGNRARLIVTANAGTKQEVRRVEIVDLGKITTFKVNLKEGRRTELASVSVAANQRRETRTQREVNAFNDLRAVANPSFFGTTLPRGGAGTPGAGMPSVADMAARDSKNQPATPIMQNAYKSNGGNGVQMTAQVRINPDQRNYDMVIRPFFDAAALRSGRPAVNLSVIPGSGN